MKINLLLWLLQSILSCRNGHCSFAPSSLPLFLLLLPCLWTVAWRTHSFCNSSHRQLTCVDIARVRP